MSKQFVIYEILFMSRNQFVCESIVQEVFEVSALVFFSTNSDDVLTVLEVEQKAN